MWDSLLGKILEKIFAKVTSVEDLIFLLIAGSCGMLTHRYWLKYQKHQQEQQKKIEDLTKEKNCKSESIKEIETYSKTYHPCHNYDVHTKELQHLTNENNEMKMRLSKVMNVLSNEFEQKWDRYLYDPSRGPEEDDL